MADPDEDDDAARIRRPLLSAEQTLSRMSADLRLLREAVTEQGKALGDLTAQVARITRRQDDSDARHLDIEDQIASDLTRIAAAMQTHTTRTDAMALRIDEIFVALTKGLQ